jgi:hypothetical protein
VGGACRTHARDEQCIQDIGPKTLKEYNTWEDLGVDWNVIVK